jgi:hypothetical protein
MSKGIDQKVIDKARALAAARAEKETTFSDSEVSGLCIRVKGSRACWHLRSKPHKIDLGELDAYRDDQIALVRELAVKVKALWKSGRTNHEIKVMLNSLLALPKAHEEPLAAAEADLAVKVDGAWTWEILRSEYLKWCKVHRADGTHGTYHSSLGAAKNSVLTHDLRFLAGKAIANITQIDILMVRQSILERGGMTDGVPVGNIRAAAQTENGLKAAFKFAMNPTRKTGLKVNPMLGLPGIETPDIKKRNIIDANDVFDRALLTPKQLYDFVFWLLKHKDNYAAEAVYSTLLQVLTGQRIETVTSTFRVQVMRTVTSWKYRYVWYLGPDKTGRYRALPLPPFAAWVAHQAALYYDERASNEDWRNHFLFRQLRAGRSGDKGGHITNHLSNDVWNDARKPGGPLAGTDFSSHDARRAFVSHLGKRGKFLGLPYDNCVKDLQSITHKGEGKATVIERHYDLDGDETWRLKVLEMWESLILSAHGEKHRPDSEMFELDDDPMNGLTPEEYKSLVIQQNDAEEDEIEAYKRRY